jgi:hypothetical protein
MSSSPIATTDVSQSETVPSIADAVSALLHAEAATFHQLVKACRVLAAADAASPLSVEERIVAASKVVVPSRRRKGYVLSMSRGTYSKRLKVGRATADQLEQFEMSCDGPSLDKFYNWLPKAEHLAKAKSGRLSETLRPMPTTGAGTPAASPEPKRKPVDVVMSLLPQCTAADLDQIAAYIVAKRGAGRAAVSSVKAA